MIPRSLAAARCSKRTLHHSTINHSLANTSSSSSSYQLKHKDWLSPNDTLKIFDNLNDPNSIIPVLNQYTHRRDYKPTEPLYTLIINKLSQANDFDAIDTLMTRIKLQKGCRLSDEFFHNVIRTYGHFAGRIKKAVDTLYDMPSFNCWPSVKTFNFVLNLLVSNKMYEFVHDVYARAPELGVEIDSCCLNILIKGLCESGNLEGAFYVFDEFPKQRCVPNVRTYSTLMHALCGSGKVDEAFGLFERMEKEGVDPDTITFNILISGLRKRGKVAEGLELFERMKQKGCYPSPSSYQEVLYCLLDTNKFQKASAFMNQMISEGASPSFVSYKRLIQGLCKQKLLGDVELVLKQMVKQGFVPKMGMWEEMVTSLISRNNNFDSISLTEVIE